VVLGFWKVRLVRASSGVFGWLLTCALVSGARMCIGSHLAVYQMKYIVAALYSNYTTSIIDDTDIEQSDAYTAPPKGGKLIVRLERRVGVM